jgi:hypothetical protein
MYGSRHCVDRSPVRDAAQRGNVSIARQGLVKTGSPA